MSEFNEANAKEAIDLYIRKLKSGPIVISTNIKPSISTDKSLVTFHCLNIDHHCNDLCPDIHSNLDSYLEYTNYYQNVFEYIKNSNCKKSFTVVEKIRFHRKTGEIKRKYDSYSAFLPTNTNHDICGYCGYDNGENGEDRMGYDCAMCGGN